MAGIKLTSEWKKIASAGDCADVLNTSNVAIDLGSRVLPPRGQIYIMELREDLFARSSDPGAAIVVNARANPPREL